MMWLMRITDDLIASEADKVRHMADVAAGRLKTSWLQSFDANANGGRGSLVMTKKRSEAMRFDSIGAVMECWQTQSTVVPLRTDGKPNRPLTAYTIEPIEDRT
jgi:hypothetical protein